MQLLTAEDVRRALPMPDAIQAMREAFTQLADGRVAMPPRTVVNVPAAGGTTLLMSARCEGRYGVGTKIVSVFPGNAARGLPLIHAVVLVLDERTGEPAALVEGQSLTALRTGAATGLATDLLARPEATRVAVIGSGVQARTQLEAVCAVRAVTSVRVYSPTAEHAERFAREMAGRGAIPSTVDVARSARQAVIDADIVCTATTSPEPVLEAEWVADGTHVNAVGSFTPAMRELDPALFGRAQVVVDQRAAALAEAGEVIAAVRGGLVDQAALIELGDVVTGRVPGRRAAADITVFKSVGLAVQDVVAAAHIVKAGASGEGTILVLL